jgi:hypothetical protein
MGEHQIKFKPPVVRVMENGNLELVEDWRVEYNGWIIEGRAGFISDGNSVPWLFRGVVPKFGRNTIAGIVHDLLYAAGSVGVNPGQVYHDGVTYEITRKYSSGKIKITRKEADRVRMDLCVWCGEWWVAVLAGYVGLRLGGWAAWRRHRRLEALRRRIGVKG